jgi:hypothetical protein
LIAGSAGVAERVGFLFFLLMQCGPSQCIDG